MQNNISRTIAVSLEITNVLSNFDEYNTLIWLQDLSEIHAQVGIHIGYIILQLIQDDILVSPQYEASRPQIELRIMIQAIFHCLFEKEVTLSGGKANIDAIFLRKIQLY